ncbi:hypothetical protein [Thermococcus sp.]|uniref:hypothetical protein n=1 Tax=Thermococcus sp. TaxID=35749 RepID=UPI0025DB358C|nr:hypothetical protein [Thermococcus sp.]
MRLILGRTSLGNLKDIQRPNHRCENTHCLFKARTKQGYWDNVNEATGTTLGGDNQAIVSSSERKPVIVILDELPEAVSNMKKEGFEGYGEVP